MLYVTAQDGNAYAITLPKVERYTARRLHCKPSLSKPGQYRDIIPIYIITPTKSFFSLLLTLTLTIVQRVAILLVVSLAKSRSQWLALAL